VNMRLSCTVMEIWSLKDGHGVDPFGSCDVSGQVIHTHTHTVLAVGPHTVALSVIIVSHRQPVSVDTNCCSPGLQVRRPRVQLVDRHHTASAHANADYYRWTEDQLLFLPLLFG